MSILFLKRVYLLQVCALRTSSEEVLLQLVKSKCLPILLYSLEVCPLTKTDLKSLDFVINKFFYEAFSNK